MAIGLVDVGSGGADEDIRVHNLHLIGVELGSCFEDIGSEFDVSFSQH